MPGISTMSPILPPSLGLELHSDFLAFRFPEHEDNAGSHFYSCKHGPPESVHGYFNMIQKLALCYDPSMLAYRLCSAIKNGLLPHLHRVVAPLLPCSMNHFFWHLLSAELEYRSLLLAPTSVCHCPDFHCNPWPTHIPCSTATVIPAQPLW